MSARDTTCAVPAKAPRTKTGGQKFKKPVVVKPLPEEQTDEITYHDDFNKKMLCGMVTWRQGQCQQCEWDMRNQYSCGWPDDHDCNESDMLVGDRVIFKVDDDGTDRPEIRCVIDHFILFMPPVKDRYLLADDVVDNPLDGTSRSVPGEVVKWKNLHKTGSGMPCQEVFDFTFTTDDTDIDVFEPHVATLARIMGLYSVSMDVAACVGESLTFSEIGRKKKKGRNRKMKSTVNVDPLNRKLRDLKARYAEMIVKNLMQTYEKYSEIYTDNFYPQNYKAGLRFAPQIATTLAHVIVEHEFQKDSHMEARAVRNEDVGKKPCAHMGMKANAK
jgi:hypothetical protein